MLNYNLYKQKCPNCGHRVGVHYFDEDNCSPYNESEPRLEWITLIYRRCRISFWEYFSGFGDLCLDESPSVNKLTMEV